MSGDALRFKIKPLPYNLYELSITKLDDDDIEHKHSFFLEEDDLLALENVIADFLSPLDEED